MNAQNSASSFHELKMFSIKRLQKTNFLIAGFTNRSRRRAWTCSRGARRTAKI